MELSSIDDGHNGHNGTSLLRHLSYFENNGAREMGIGWIDDEDNNEHNNISLVEMFEIFAPHGCFCNRMAPFERV